MKMVISDDDLGIPETIGTSGGGTIQTFSIKISLSQLVKQKWFLDYISDKVNKELEIEKFMYNGGAGL